MRKKGFSLVEILATVALLGIIAVPFLNMFLRGNKLATESKNDMIAVNLARERIEQILTENFEAIDEDYYLYKDIYKDTIVSEAKDADKDPEIFYKVFTDVWTPELKDKYPRIYNKFKETRERVSVLSGYILYPDSYSSYRRYTTVEELDTDKTVSMKKITVWVYYKKKLKFKLSTLVSDYK